MRNFIPDTLDHHAVGGTHCQWPNDAGISAVTDVLQNELDGPYHLFRLIQEESNPNNPHGNHNKQLSHHDLVTGILDAMMYLKQLIPSILVTRLVSEI